MSNNNSNNSNDKNTTENKAVTGVEVVKDDTVVYEDGDFKDYNAANDIQADKKDDSQESEHKDTPDDKEKVDKSAKKADKSKNDADNKSAEKEDKASHNKAAEDKESDKSEPEEADSESDKTDKPQQEEKSGITMAGIYQWASKLKDEFTSEAADFTHEVTEKAAAMTLGKLLDAVEFELMAFDKSIEAAKKLIENAEEERKKIASKKEKYQGMIDKLDQE